ncbi:MAG TPA: hypothetical protein VGG51_03250 [Candidatus Cybelea sp.]|jgi:hypothetical protein
MSPIGADRTWRFSLATRIALGFLAVFMFGISALLFGLPYAYSADRSGEWMVLLTGVVTTGFGLFATFGLVAAVRTRVTLGAATLEARVIAGHSRLLVPHFREVRLPLSDIRAVERRSEIFTTLGFSTMRDALSIVTAEGERIGLFSNTLGNASTLPLDEVASAIAAASGIAVTDDGTVRAKGSGLYGAASSSWSEAPLDDTSARKARRAAIATVQFCAVLLLLTLVLRACL